MSRTSLLRKPDARKKMPADKAGTYYYGLSNLSFYARPARLLRYHVQFSILPADQ